MTKEKIQKLKIGDIVHFKNDVKGKYYDWEVLNNSDSSGLVIQNDYMNPRYITEEDYSELIKDD